MARRRIVAAALAVTAAGVLAGCGSTGKAPDLGAAGSTVPAVVGFSSPSPPSSFSSPSPSSTSSAATPTPVSAPRTSARQPSSAPRTTAISSFPVAHPPAGAAWTWSPRTPPACTPKTTAESGAYIQGILVRSPIDNSTAWNGWVGQDQACFAYAVGVIDGAAKTIQLLVMDTSTRTQKAFTGHVGDSVVVGRFTVKVNPPSGLYGQTLFEVGFYWG